MAGAKGTAKLAFDLLVNAIILPKEAYSMAEDLFVDDEEQWQYFVPTCLATHSGTGNRLK